MLIGKSCLLKHPPRRPAVIRGRVAMQSVHVHVLGPARDEEAQFIQVANKLRKTERCKDQTGWRSGGVVRLWIHLRAWDLPV